MSNIDKPSSNIDKPRLILGKLEFDQGGNTVSTRSYMMDGRRYVFGRFKERPQLEYGVVMLPNSAKEIITFASKLYKDPRLETLANKFEQDKFDQETTAILDLLIASIFFKDGRVREEYGIDAIDDFLLYLGGDQAARNRLYANLAEIKSSNEEEFKRQQREVQEHAKQFNYPELDPKELVLVHATNYEPVKDDLGRIVLKPLANYEHVARSTLHFCVNSLMEPQPHRTTEGRYILVSSLDSLINEETCGIPDGITGVDTYYSLGPGDSIHLPLDTIVLDRMQFKPASELNIALIEAMRSQGAKNIYRAAFNHLDDTDYSVMNNIEFQRGLTALALKNGSISVGLQLGTPNSQVELMFYYDTLAIPYGSSQPKPYVATGAIIENLRWAVLRGMWPTSIAIDNRWSREGILDLE